MPYTRKRTGQKSWKRTARKRVGVKRRSTRRVKRTFKPKRTFKKRSAAKSVTRRPTSVKRSRSTVVARRAKPIGARRMTGKTSTKVANTNFFGVKTQNYTSLLELVQEVQYGGV